MLFFKLRLTNLVKTESQCKSINSPCPQSQGDYQPKNSQQLRQKQKVDELRNIHRVYYLKRPWIL